MRPAVFIDRDGTMIELVPYLSDPSQVRLMEQAGAAIRRLNELGIPVVVITNQSGIGRKYYSEEAFWAVQHEVERQLAAYGARTDAVYFCPIACNEPDKTRVVFLDRKPGPGMLRRAAEEHVLDLDRSWMIGDSISDVHAGRNAGCATILVKTGYGGVQDQSDSAIDQIASDLSAAIDLVIQQYRKDR